MLYLTINLGRLKGVHIDFNRWKGSRTGFASVDCLFFCGHSFCLRMKQQSISFKIEIKFIDFEWLPGKVQDSGYKFQVAGYR